MVSLLDRPRNRDSARLIDLLDGRRPRDDAPAGLLGIENEYTLTSAGRRLDFRSFIHELTINGRRLDPGDRHAYRTTSGIAITCDDAEAEVACPPVSLAPGFVSMLDGWSSSGARELSNLLPLGVQAAGFSTHVSAALPASLSDRVASLYASTFAPALMLLAERRDSYGIYVRPRPGRLELCSDFVDGAHLRAVSAFVAGSVRAAARRVAGGRKATEDFPPFVLASLAPSTERYGVYVGRRAFGGNLYQTGRKTSLLLPGGGTITAQQHLERAWAASRATLLEDAAPEDLALVDRIVAGSLPLRVEGEIGAAESSGTAPSSVFGDAVPPRYRAAFSAVASIVTWEFVVFELNGASRKAYACIPRRYLGDFLARLDSGQLDETLVRFLQRSPGTRVLAQRSQTQEPGLYDRVGRPEDLLPAEREPSGILVLRPGDGERSGKRVQAVDAFGIPWWRRPAFFMLLGLAAVAVGAYALLSGGGSSESEESAAVLPSVAPAATSGAQPTQTAPTPVPAAPTGPAAATTAPAPAPAPPPADLTQGVGPISATAVTPVTTYTVQNSRPGLTYTWTGPDCGTNSSNANVMTWSHPHPPCDPTTQHAGIMISVVVSDGTNRVRCNYQGASAGTGPACVPI